MQVGIKASTQNSGLIRWPEALAERGLSKNFAPRLLRTEK